MKLTVRSEQFARGDEKSLVNYEKIEQSAKAPLKKKILKEAYVVEGRRE